MRKIIVFDFDKTLTYKDSLRELFLHEMNGSKYPLRLFYFGLMILSKVGVITVRKEKELMIRALFHNDNDLFAGKCREQAGNLKLNPLFNLVKEYLAVGNRVVILSASSIYLLNEVFKGMNVEIIGTTFLCDSGKIIKIEQHPFYKEKLDSLVLHGVTDVDELFYDSSRDECLIPLCKKWNKVKKGHIVKTEFSK